MKKAILTTIMGILLCSSASAQTVKGRGIGSVTYEPNITAPPTSKDQNAKKKGAVVEQVVVGASARDKEIALRNARLNAIKSYFDDRGQAGLKNFERIKDKINEMLDSDDIIRSAVILNEKDESGRYTVTISVVISEGALNLLIEQVSAVGTAFKSQKSDIVYLFIGREVETVRQIGPTVTTGTSAKAEGMAASKAEVRAASEAKEGERVTASQTSTTAERREKAEARIEAERRDSVEVKTEKTTSSETVIKRDQVSYKLLPMINYLSNITNVFTQAGFDPIEPAEVIGDYLSFVNSDYEKGNDIDAGTYKAMTGKLRDADISYLVLAVLDVGTPEIDPATGLNSVVVSASVRVIDVSSRFSREVASVPVYQRAGRGTSVSEAQKNAISASSQHAAREVVERLNARDVR
jgi:hypothetical protein